jgi:hypothetical protein
MSDMLNVVYSKFYNPSEHLAIDEVIVLFKGRVVFKQYIPKKHKRFGIKLSNSVTPLATHMTWKCTWVRTDNMPQQT